MSPAALAFHDKRLDAPWMRSGARLLLTVVVLLCGQPASADLADTLSEARVKAAFLFKFTGYVTWPANAFEQPDTPLVICTMEADEVAAELARLTAGRLAGTHPMATRRLGATDATTACHALFMGSAVSGRIGKVMNAIRPQALLTVTELDDALTFSSVINFVVVDDQVRFDVSLPAAERGNLKISARLLAVARQVVTVPSP